MEVSDETKQGFARLLNTAMPRSPRYRFYAREGSKDRYFYTTEKVNHNGKPRYVAGIYRYISSRKIFKMVKSAGFAKKYKAIAAAERYLEVERKAVAEGRQRV